MLFETSQDSISLLNIKENENGHAGGGYDMQIEEMRTFAVILGKLLQYSQRVRKDHES